MDIQKLIDELLLDEQAAMKAVQAKAKESDDALDELRQQQRLLQVEATVFRDVINRTWLVYHKECEPLAEALSETRISLGRLLAWQEGAPWEGRITAFTRGRDHADHVFGIKRYHEEVGA